MKIKLNKEDTDRLIKLLETKEENIAMASMLNDMCFSLDSFSELNDATPDNLNKVAKDIFIDYFELDIDNDDNKRIINTYLNDAFNLEEIDQYNNNPYKKAINIKEIEQNSYKLHYLSYPKNSFFPLDDIKVDEEDYYREYTSLGYFTNDYKYLTLSKNNNIWMCITPNEINTMKPHIDKAKGSVVTFGLGLGYFAFMCANKDNVKKVTIVERDNEIINLFTNYLLPLFPHKEKIDIVNEDAFTYINKNHLRENDYAFFDLWHNAKDGLPMYLKIKNTKIDIPTGYWIEESLITMYRRCLLTVIEESLSGYSDDDYRKSKNAIDKVINEIYFKTKNLKLNSYKEIHNLLSKENIKSLIAK